MSSASRRPFTDRVLDRSRITDVPPLRPIVRSVTIGLTAVAVTHLVGLAFHF